MASFTGLTVHAVCWAPWFSLHGLLSSRRLDQACLDDSKGIPQCKCRIDSSLSLNSAAKTSHKVALDSGSEERDAISSWIELQQCNHVLFNLLQYISRILIIIASALWNEHYYSWVEYKLTSLKRNHIYRYKQEFWNQIYLVRIQAPSILTQDNCMTLIDQFPIAV